MIYATNTAGAIAGALAGSFILVPQLGLQTVAPARIDCSPCWRVRSSHGGLRRSRYRPGALPLAASLAATVVAFALLMPPWNHARLANGAYRFAPSLAAGDIETALEAGDLSYYREGAAGTVSVRRLIGVTSLAIDGKVDASNGGDMLTQKLLAHLPLLLHGDPTRVVHHRPRQRRHAGRRPAPSGRARRSSSEISPEVVAASQLLRRRRTTTRSHDPRTRLIVGDGRSHLLLSGDRYDVIISEPSNPWMAGVARSSRASSSTAARSRLAPGGILCQWAHTYDISDADLRSIVATFLSVFPDGSAGWSASPTCFSSDRRLPYAHSRRD